VRAGLFDGGAARAPDTAITRACIHAADGSIQNNEWSAPFVVANSGPTEGGAQGAAQEEDPMTTAQRPVSLSLLARLEAKPGKEAEVEAGFAPPVGRTGRPRRDGAGW
jgi:hypothetical protein